MTAIGFKSFQIDDVPFLVDGELTAQGNDVVIASGQTSSLTPSYRIPPGSVVVKKTSGGKFYLADNATDGDRNAAPSITTSGHADGNGVIKITGNRGTFSVTTSTGSGTEANNATDLNADANFSAHYVASSGGGELTIAARATGAEEWFYVHADTMATAGFAEGVANAVSGSDADYRVTAAHVDLEDMNGSATDAVVPTLLRGKFDESELSNLTAEAKATLIRRGSRFE